MDRRPRDLLARPGNATDCAPLGSLLEWGPWDRRALDDGLADGCARCDMGRDGERKEAERRERPPELPDLGHLDPLPTRATVHIYEPLANLNHGLALHSCIPRTEIKVGVCLSWRSGSSQDK